MDTGDFQGSGVNLWEKLARLVRETLELKKQEEVAIEDVPDEFQCPIMMEIMMDPVQLPGGIIVDRSSIMQQLLNQGVNPFTRAPMSVKDLVPQPELKAKIQKWLAEQRKAPEQ